MSGIKDKVINHCLSDVYALPTSVETVLNRKPDVESNKFLRFNASSDRFVFLGFFHRFFYERLPFSFRESITLHSYNEVIRRIVKEHGYSFFEIFFDTLDGKVFLFYSVTD